jgi:hypothetical protein
MSSHNINAYLNASHATFGAIDLKLNSPDTQYECLVPSKLTRGALIIRSFYISAGILTQNFESITNFYFVNFFLALGLCRTRLETQRKRNSLENGKEFAIWQTYLLSPS